MLGLIFPIAIAWAVKNAYGSPRRPTPQGGGYIPPPPPPPAYSGPRGGETPRSYPAPPPPPAAPLGARGGQSAAPRVSNATPLLTPPPPPGSAPPGIPLAPLAAPGPPPGPAVPVQQLDLANDLAGRLLENIRRAGFSYDRKLCEQFQLSAGLGADGKYGGRTAGALVYFTGQQPPTPLYEPKNVIPYLPPGSKKPTSPQVAPVLPNVPAPSLDQLDLASKLAFRVLDDIKAKGRGYDRNLLQQFQALARLKVDGEYGGGSAGALAYFTASVPPAPIYKPTTIKPYRPPGL